MSLVQEILVLQADRNWFELQHRLEVEHLDCKHHLDSGLDFQLRVQVVEVGHSLGQIYSNSKMLHVHT